MQVLDTMTAPLDGVARTGFFHHARRSLLRAAARRCRVPMSSRSNRRKADDMRLARRRCARGTAPISVSLNAGKSAV